MGLMFIHTISQNNAGPKDEHIIFYADTVLNQRNVCMFSMMKLKSIFKLTWYGEIFFSADFVALQTQPMLLH